jgi:hypothetical protein
VECVSRCHAASARRCATAELHMTLVCAPTRRRRDALRMPTKSASSPVIDLEQPSMQDQEDFLKRGSARAVAVAAEVHTLWGPLARAQPGKTHLDVMRRPASTRLRDPAPAGHRPRSAPGMGAEQKVSRCSIRAETSPSGTLTEGTPRQRQGHLPGAPGLALRRENVAACPQGGVWWKSEGAVRNRTK